MTRVTAYALSFPDFTLMSRRYGVCWCILLITVAGYVIEIDKDTKASSLADSFRAEIQRKLKEMNVRRAKELPFQAVNEALLSSTGRAILFYLSL